MLFPTIRHPRVPSFAAEERGTCKSIIRRQCFPDLLLLHAVREVKIHLSDVAAVKREVSFAWIVVTFSSAYGPESTNIQSFQTSIGND